MTAQQQSASRWEKKLNSFLSKHGKQWSLTEAALLSTASAPPLRLRTVVLAQTSAEPFKLSELSALIDSCNANTLHTNYAFFRATPYLIRTVRMVQEQCCAYYGVCPATSADEDGGGGGGDGAGKGIVLIQLPKALFVVTYTAPTIASEIAFDVERFATVELFK
ncbi:hypothetical protein QOT17_005016 [Balamuthia mandrillaris]